MPAAERDGGWESLFWLLFRRSSNPVALADDKRVVIDINDAAVELLGRSRSEQAGLSIVDIVSPSEREQSAREWDEFLRTGEYSGSRDLVRADGTEVPVDFAARLAHIDGRRLAIYVIMARSVMARSGSWPTPAVRPKKVAALTKREREVVTLIAMGLETDEIAQELRISPETVRTHVRNSLAKLGAHTRAQLVAIVLSSEGAMHPPTVDTGTIGAGAQAPSR